MTGGSKRKRVRLEPEPVHENVELGQYLYRTLQSWFMAHKEGCGIDEVKYAGLAGAALMQLSAVIAVDVNCPRDKFLAICSTLYDHSYQKAPKFG